MKMPTTPTYEPDMSQALSFGAPRSQSFAHLGTATTWPCPATALNLSKLPLPGGMDRQKQTVRHEANSIPATGSRLCA